MPIRIWLSMLALVASAPLAAQSNQALQGTSGLPVPRFVSLSAGEANMRAGPGDTYPVTWVYRRAGLPLEVIAEYGIWRRVRDADGVTGWMNKNLLSGVRTALIRRAVRTLHAKAEVDARPVLRVEPGVIARIDMCEEDWCRLEVAGRKGFLPRNQFWGTYPGETVED